MSAGHELCRTMVLQHSAQILELVNQAKTRDQSRTHVLVCIQTGTIWDAVIDRLGPYSDNDGVIVSGDDGAAIKIVPWRSLRRLLSIRPNVVTTIEIGRISCLSLGCFFGVALHEKTAMGLSFVAQ